MDSTLLHLCLHFCDLVIQERHEKFSGKTGRFALEKKLGLVGFVSKRPTAI